MALLAGLAACFALWWYWTRRGLAFPAGFARQAPGWIALALAGLCLMRGRLDLALVLGLAGAWLIDGPAGLAKRVKRLLAPPPGVIAWSAGPPGALPSGTVRAGPFAGARLDALGLPALRDLLAFCRLREPASAGPLEAYLDRRHPGWREHAQRDADPRPGRPAKPGAMSEQEAYEVLGLERGASPEEIRAAHRALMKRLHPDQGGSAERAARVNAARDRLTDRHR